MSRRNINDMRAYREDTNYGITRSGTIYSPDKSPQLSEGDGSVSDSKDTRERLAELEARMEGDIDVQPKT